MSEDWGIGPNPNGGFVLALLTNAMRRVAGAMHPDPVSMTAHYLRPTSAGERADITVGVVRQGRRHTHLEATLSQGSERVRALAVFGDLEAASGPTAVRAEPPALPEPDEGIARTSVAGTVMAGSTFLDRFDTRLSPDTGWITGNPTGVAEVRGWMRFADGREPDVASLGLFA
ncbi:MAG TPA: thioesterase family protein, partial [Acidimicrobiales bacterium]|nr:thioesterase family protein [Acidimicrobiales bacterium]